MLHFKTLRRDTKIYHERDDFFISSNVEEKPCAKQSWFSFKPFFFSNGDLPDYDCVIYEYSVISPIELLDIEDTVEFNNRFLNVINSSKDKYRLSFDDYLTASIVCDALGLEGFQNLNMKMLIMDRKVVHNKLKLNRVITIGDIEEVTEEFCKKGKEIFLSPREKALIKNISLRS